LLLELLRDREELPETFYSSSTAYATQ